jgi:hypothetical protein
LALAVLKGSVSGSATLISGVIELIEQ